MGRVQQAFCVSVMGRVQQALRVSVVGRVRQASSPYEVRSLFRAITKQSYRMAFPVMA